MAEQLPSIDPRSIPSLTLRDSVTIPQIGLGVFKIDPEITQEAVEAALALGYRHIDTATGYNNEAQVGAALKASGLPRDEIFVTTKLYNPDHKAGDVRGAFERSLTALGLDAVDLYLIHWPLPRLGLYVDTWKELEKVKLEGLAREIGVSNFEIPHLEKLIDETAIIPAVDQVELHPLFQQRELRAFLKEKGIQIEAWAPLGQGRFDLGAYPALSDAAQAHGKSVAQVILRWHLQTGIVAIPKAINPVHMRENLDIADFELTADEMAAIDALDTGHRLAADPNTHE
ncbi:MAG: aldo/keto reductase [Propionibacteriaceae bacterium]|jgi:2,5-diketo-D-gluconate reductase A|nr:aldo/keto reductase [Propionibacteriaceae bacterium]